MFSDSGFFSVVSNAVQRIQEDSERDGWLVLSLPSRISTREDFFNAVRDTLPLDPALSGNRSWDALADSLWSGLYMTPQEKILIVWPESTSMRNRFPADFAIACEILSDLPLSLSDKELPDDRKKRLVVILAA
ncbi:barstar family protein [Silvibacterium sp.]|uniref:barstar family protein n=1 Tax=Silvibacterium sp. TaxID=1964179 RepID=UPI0039E3653F